jgi:hypothetical protein
MTLGGRAHAHPPGAVRGKTRKLDANWPIAPQIHAPCEVSGSENRPRASAGPPNSQPQTRISAWNLLGCHRIFERRKGRAGSAPHPSVTVLSVNKALTISGSLGRFLILVASRRSAREQSWAPHRNCRAPVLRDAKHASATSSDACRTHYAKNASGESALAIARIAASRDSDFSSDETALLPFSCRV